MSNIITIFGLGVSGIEMLKNIEFNLYDQINIVELIEIKHDLLKSNRIRIFNSFKSLEAEVKFLGNIIICVPPNQMNSILNQLTNENSLNVLIEKPGPSDLFEANEIISRYENKKNIFINHQRQYSDHFNWVSNHISSGTIGELDYVIITLQKWDFHTACTHWLALMDSCFGTPIEVFGNTSLSNKINEKYGYKVEDSSFFKIKYLNSTTTIIVNINEGQRSDIRFIGKDGVIDLKFDDSCLAKIISNNKTLKFKEYGKPRSKIINALVKNELPVLGCRFLDIINHRKIYRASILSRTHGKSIYLNEIKLTDLNL